jgi:hypothetical protein
LIIYHFPLYQPIHYIKVIFTSYKLHTMGKDHVSPSSETYRQCLAISNGADIQGETPRETNKQKAERERKERNKLAAEAKNTGKKGANKKNKGSRGSNEEAAQIVGGEGETKN